MKNFILKSHIIFTVDQQRIVIVNKEKGTSVILEYPEAALWSLMIENNDPVKVKLMLMSVLQKSESETGNLMDKWLKEWKESGIME